MRLMLVVMIVAACLMPAGKGTAGGMEEWTQQLSFSGLLETIHSVRVRKPSEALTSRARMRLELGLDLDSVYGFFSADAEKNWKMASETGVDLQEAWLEHVGNGWVRASDGKSSSGAKPTGFRSPISCPRRIIPNR
jgi:hypothetical protein